MINTRYISFSGKVEIPSEIDKQKSLIIAGEFDISDYSERPNEDGTYDVIYKVKPIRVMNQSEGGERVYFKTNEKRHVKFYRAIMHYCKEHAIENHDEFYDKLMGYLNSHVEELVGLKKLYE